MKRTRATAAKLLAIRPNAIVIIEEHDPECPQIRAATGAVAVECEHGHDCCPICDPCTCNPAKDE